MEEEQEIKVEPIEEDISVEAPANPEPNVAEKRKQNLLKARETKRKRQKDRDDEQIRLNAAVFRLHDRMNDMQTIMQNIESSSSQHAEELGKIREGIMRNKERLRGATDQDYAGVTNREYFHETGNIKLRPEMRETKEIPRYVSW
jgi:predicted  nucleic acid-binding Zn-ribbon protein